MLFTTLSASASYPDRTIKIVAPFAPGGGTDVAARALAQEMSRDLGVAVIIENDEIAAAPADRIGILIVRRGCRESSTPFVDDMGERQQDSMGRK